MKKIIFIAFILSAACSNNPKQFDKSNYDKSRQTIMLNEKNDPLHFLAIRGDRHKNIFGKTITNSVITNSATVCSYTDIRVKMLSYNKERNMIEEHEDVYKGLLKPSGSADFKTKYHLPKNVDSIGLSIMSAAPVVDSVE